MTAFWSRAPRKIEISPAEKARLSVKIRQRLSPACCTNDITFSPITGKTQGMTLSKIPAIRAQPIFSRMAKKVADFACGITRSHGGATTAD